VRRCALPLLYDQKWAAQRAVQDREAQFKSVEDILAEAALANAQLAVAKAVLKAEFRREGATVEEATAKAEEAVEKLAPQLVFGRTPMGMKPTRRKRSPAQVAILYIGNLVNENQGNNGHQVAPMLPPSPGQAVQLAFL